MRSSFIAGLTSTSQPSTGPHNTPRSICSSVVSGSRILVHSPLLHGAISATSGHWLLVQGGREPVPDQQPGRWRGVRSTAATGHQQAQLAGRAGQHACIRRLHWLAFRHHVQPGALQDAGDAPHRHIYLLHPWTLKHVCAGPAQGCMGHVAALRPVVEHKVLTM